MQASAILALSRQLASLTRSELRQLLAVLPADAQQRLAVVAAELLPAARHFRVGERVNVPDGYERSGAPRPWSDGHVTALSGRFVTVRLDSGSTVTAPYYSLRDPDRA